jgi:hypothetical protein
LGLLKEVKAIIKLREIYMEIGGILRRYKQ